ncbi:hypothetical protein K7432_013404, partial [Basidiobolus ranarum]
MTPAMAASHKYNTVERLARTYKKIADLADNRDIFAQHIENFPDLYFVPSALLELYHSIGVGDSIQPVYEA